MFKLFQSFMGKESGRGDDLDDNSLESLSNRNSNSLSFAEDVESSSEKAELLWQQKNLKETITLYDREIETNPNSVEAYEQLLSHLHQQNSVADAYKQLAESLQQKGQNEEAASCYRQAIVIQAVTNEVAEKYQDKIPTKKLGRVAPVADLTEEAFSFQGSIKQSSQERESNILQIELSGGHIPNLSPGTEIGQLDSQKIAKVEWEAAQTLMQKALDHCDREEWSEVARVCEQATEIMPEMAEAYKIWGNALQRINHTAEAMECYGKAIEIQPDLAEVYSGIARLYAQQQKWQPATEYYQRAIIIKPEFARAYRSLAHVWEQCGELEKAKICHLRAGELEGEPPKIEEAMEQEAVGSKASDLAEITQATVDSVTTYHQLAQDSEEQNLWHEAAVYYRKALELNLSQNKALMAGDNSSIPEANNPVQSPDRESLAPIDDSAIANKNKGKGQENRVLPSLEQAIGTYRKQVKLQPDSSNLQIELGDLYAKKRKWQSALACYSKAIRIDPKKAEAHLKLAKILGKTGNHASYVEHMYLAYTIKPSLGSADDHFLLGEAIKKLGHRNKAIACYEQAIKLQPHFSEAYESLAATYKEIGKSREAIACYQAAIRHNPQNADFHFNLGELLDRQSSWEESVKAYRQVLELQPKYPQASQKLNNALSKKLQQDLAVKYQKTN